MGRPALHQNSPHLGQSGIIERLSWEKMMDEEINADHYKDLEGNAQISPSSGDSAKRRFSPSLILMMWFRNKTYRLAKTSNGLPVRKFHLQNWLLFNLTKWQNERKKNTLQKIEKLQLFSSVISKEFWWLWWPRGSCWTKNKFEKMRSSSKWLQS